MLEANLPLYPALDADGFVTLKLPLAAMSELAEKLHQLETLKRVFEKMFGTESGNHPSRAAFKSHLSNLIEKGLVECLGTETLKHIQE